MRSLRGFLTGAGTEAGSGSGVGSGVGSGSGAGSGIGSGLGVTTTSSSFSSVANPVEEAFLRLRLGGELTGSSWFSSSFSIIKCCWV